MPKISEETGCEFYSGRNMNPRGRNFYGHNQNWNLILTESGKTILLLAEKKILVEPGSLVLIEPGMPRLFKVKEDWMSQWINFNMEPYVSVSHEWQEAIPHVFHCFPSEAECKKILHLFAEIRELCRTRRIGWYRLGYCLVQEIILRGNMAQAKGLDAQRIELVSRMLEHICEPDTVDELAYKCSMSRAGFFAKFKETFGVSPRVYRERMIMVKIRDLLTFTDLSVKEIALSTGFGNPFYLSNKFKKIYGISPSQYRKSITSGTKV